MIITRWVCVTSFLVAGLHVAVSLPAEAQTGDLTVTVENVDAGSSEYPGSNGSVVLYDSNYNQVDTKGTDSQGQVTFYEVTTGDDYIIEAYHDPDQQPSAYGTEFWGGQGNISISSGSNSLTFTRNQPYVSGVAVFNEDTGDRVAPQEIIDVNTPLRVEVTLKNPNEPGSYEKNVRARMLVDQSRSSPYDRDWTTSSRLLSSGGTAKYTFSFTPSNRGPYYIAPASQTEVGGSFTHTDTWSWGSEPRFTVNRSPVAEHASPSSSTVQVSATDSKEFTVEATDLDDNLKSVDWQIEEPGGSWSYTGDSDGLSGGLDQASHTASFPETGEYRVKAIVYDQKDELSTATWTIDVAPQTGDLAVTVENVDAGSSEYPGSNGSVVLYDSNYNQVDTKGTDSQGQVTFYEVSTGDDYIIEAYHDPDQQPSAYGTEFWGGQGNISISSGSNSLTFTRNQPYVQNLQVYKTETGSRVTYESVEYGTELRIEVTLKNPDEPGAFSRNAKPRLLIDRDKSSGFDFDNTSGAKSISKGGSSEFEFTYTPSRKGDYFAAPAALSETDGSFALSDTWSWTDAPIFSVVKDETQEAIEFADYTWNVKEGEDLGPGSNDWSSSPRSVWTDDQGRLHLKIREVGQTWHSAEVYTQKSLGYGTYRFKISSDVESYGPLIVAGLFTYEAGEGGAGPEEIDIEFSQWGGEDPVFPDSIGTYVVRSNSDEFDRSQKYDSDFKKRFDPNLTGTYSTHEFTWTDRKVHFISWHGHADSPSPNTLMQDTTYDEDEVPIEGDGRLHLNLWLDQNKAPDGPVEFVVDTLSYRSGTIPVELASFGGNFIDQEGIGSNAVRLNWRTASEQNNAGFKIQRRSSHSGTWNQIGYREGAGTTSEVQTYRFTDETLPYSADTLQYRLRQVDLDGSATVTDPITIARKGPEKLRLLDTAPNPAQQQTTVRYSVPKSVDDAAQLRLYDVLGRQVRSAKINSESGRHEHSLDVGNLPSGVYILRLQAGGRSSAEKMAVVR